MTLRKICFLPKLLRVGQNKCEDNYKEETVRRRLVLRRLTINLEA